MRAMVPGVNEEVETLHLLPLRQQVQGVGVGAPRKNPAMYV